MPETLEAEIIEIDGKPPPASEADPAGSFRREPPRWFVLDRRWWPLWILLGAFALVVGVFAGAIYLVFAFIRLAFRLMFGTSK